MGNTLKEQKQIEEMAFEMTRYKETVCKRIEDNNCLLRFHTHAFVDCHFCKLAEHLITEKDYRKASDVAKEIFAEIHESIKAEKFHHKNFGDLVYLADIDRIIAELKKKYTEGEE